MKIGKLEIEVTKQYLDVWWEWKLLLEIPWREILNKIVNPKGKSKWMI